MGDDLRHRYAEALAAKFTYPVYRSDRDGENERVDNAEPADRIDQSPYVMSTAGDGCRSFWTPTCAELGEVVAAVRDEELEQLKDDALGVVADAAEELQMWRERAETAELRVARVRATFSVAILYGPNAAPAVPLALLLDALDDIKEEAETDEIGRAHV